MVGGLCWCCSGAHQMWHPTTGLDMVRACWSLTLALVVVIDVVGTPKRQSPKKKTAPKGQWTGDCGYFMADFDPHSVCIGCREKWKGGDPCANGLACRHCEGLTEDQRINWPNDVPMLPGNRNALNGKQKSKLKQRLHQFVWGSHLSLMRMTF